MIVKGLIKTINFSDNSCTVRIPLFETAAVQGEVILPAAILIQPGMYNGYSEGDIVFVDFENDKLNQPIVLGKLYLGAAKEEASLAQSALAVSNLTVTSKATLPIDTRLVLEETGDVVPVENGITSYKTITDIIKALYKTEASVEQTARDQSEVIASIKVEYLSQSIGLAAPDAANPAWTTVTPVYKDTYAIWQKTTCYNHRGQILSTEIICLTDVNSSATYRLRCSTRVHAGPSQTDAVSIKAMVKLGSSLEIQDDSAKLYYRWSGETEVEKVGSGLYLSSDDLKEKNLIVDLVHEDTTKANGDPELYIYDTETIMYAPLNTPIIMLSKDTDVILYTADGKQKLGDDVVNTAELYVNGNILAADYSWTWNEQHCTCSYPIDEEGNPIYSSIIISAVNSDTRTGTATCTATVTAEGPFFGKSYTKDFTVTQTRVGENATSYWLTSSCTVHTGRKHNAAITITAMKKVGESDEELDMAARLWWKYKTESSDSWKHSEDFYRIAIPYNEILDADLLVLATHNITFDPTKADILTDSNIYEREEITFSPLNTPVLSLTNDSGALSYGSNGQKITDSDTVETTAELYLNGSKIDSGVGYEWRVTDCITSNGKQEGVVSTSPTISIKYLNANTAYATCTASYGGESYSKVFTVVKQIQGVSIVSQTTYYALVHNKFPDETSGRITTLISPDKTDLAVYVQTDDDATSKRSLNRLDQATTSAAIDAAETWGEWSIAPPAHTEDTNGWKFWTTIETIYSSGVVSFSKPIINEDLSGVYALAQGKSTNYYSDTDPSEHYTIKEGDCWFKTTGQNTELADSPRKGELKQWTNGQWEDIGSEIVANKITATYINALDITAKKIEILDTDSTPLFEADGTDGLHKVTIGGYSVVGSTLQTGTEESGNKIILSGEKDLSPTDERLVIGDNFKVQADGTVTAKNLVLYSNGDNNKTSLDDDDKPGVYLGPDGISIGTGFKVEAKGTGETQVTLSEEVSEQISAVSYWLSSTCTVHTGSKHGQAIVVIAMKKVGNAEESQDTGAYLWWRHKNAIEEDSTPSAWVLATAQYKYRINFAPDEVPNDDILIIATHDSSFDPNAVDIDLSTDSRIYEKEEIPFSPVNTPIINLTNDSASLAYNGDSKITSTDTVSTTAELWLNGSKITNAEEVAYTWAFFNCDGTKSTTAVTDDTVTINTLSSNIATAIVTATYKDDQESYTKVFTISKQLKGDTGGPGDPGDPGRSVLSTIKYYKLCNETLTDGDQPNNSVANPTESTNKAKTDRNKGWQISPPTFVEGYDYYETVRTEYNDGTYSWSVPVKNSMLTVDFMNALGITAKKIVVTTDVTDEETGEEQEQIVFMADGADKENPHVELAGFTVHATNLVGTNTAGHISISPSNIILGESSIDEAPFYVQSNGVIKATKGEISGFIIGNERTGAGRSGPVFKSKPDPTVDQEQLYTMVNTDPSYYRDFIKDPSWVRVYNGSTDVSDSYCVYESDSFHRSNVDTYAKLTFEVDLDSFTFYIASSGEQSRNGDFMLVGYANSSTVKNGEYYGYMTKTTPLDLSEIDRTDTASAPDAGITKLDLTNTKIQKITLTNVKKGDYHYIYYIKDRSNNFRLDTGWLIMPSQASMERHNRIFITPTGSSASIAGEGRSDWGLTIGDNFGIALDGSFYAIDANLYGHIEADDGVLGGFSFNKEALASDTIAITPSSISIVDTKSNSLTMSTDKYGPYIEFSAGGELKGPGGDYGFRFPSADDATESTKTSYRAIATRSGSDENVKVTVKIQQYTKNGWQDCSDGLPSGVSFSDDVIVKGRDKYVIGGKNISDSCFFYLHGSTWTVTKSYSGDFDTISSYYFEDHGGTEYTWEHTTTASDNIISLGGIRPLNGYVSDLGTGAKPWRSTFTNNIYYEVSGGLSSDRKVKNTIAYDISKYDDFFDQLKPASYKYNNGTSDRTHLGFIAQDIQDSIEQTNLTSKDCSIVVIEGEGFDKEQGKVLDEAKTHYYIRPDELHALEVRQIHLLKERIKQQDVTIAELMQRLEKLESKN